MSEKVFDRETLLDLTVNVIPFGILAIFFAAYVLFNPFEGGSVITAIQLAIVGVSGIGLMILTYYSGAAVSKAEMKSEAALEAEEAEQAELDADEAEAAELDDDEPAELDGDETADEE
jgi:D-arabinose 1-dehydrogenase-like Zn-dependent alcohol dehydrogenase